MRPLSASVQSIVVATALLVSTGSCATSPATQAVADVLLPPADENLLGVEMSREFERQVKLLDDPQIQRYVAGLGHKVVSVADVPAGLKFSFKVVDDPATVNAVTLPGGHIYVYSGLLAMSEDESELVAVLAHEVAHVTQRHIASQLVTMFGIQTLGSLALGQDPSQLSQLVAGIVAQGYMLQFSRDAERAADLYGLMYETRAGWDPHGYVSFFQKLARQDAPVPTFLRSHPEPLERVANARQLIQRIGPQYIPDHTGRERYQRMLLNLERQPELAGRTRKPLPRR